MDMRYTYEELWEAYQNLLRENAVLNQEIQRLKSGNAGGTVGCSTLSQKEQPGVRLSLEEKVALFRSCLLYTCPSPRDSTSSRMPSSA